jgi:hypothetical protein
VTNGDQESAAAVSWSPAEGRGFPRTGQHEGPGRQVSTPSPRFEWLRVSQRCTSMTAYGKVVATLVGPKLCPLGFLEQNSFLCRRRSAISAMYTQYRPHTWSSSTFQVVWHCSWRFVLSIEASFETAPSRGAGPAGCGPGRRRDGVTQWHWPGNGCFLRRAELEMPLALPGSDSGAGSALPRSSLLVVGTPAP